MPTLRSLEERFREKVDTNGPIHPVLGTRCHPWIGCRNAGGYGTIAVKGRVVLAHRIAWEMEHGPLPRDKGPGRQGPRGTCVLHRCDNGGALGCVNHEHLFLGTQRQNVRDCIAKGRFWNQSSEPRSARGERHGHAKLTVAIVTALRSRHAAGETQIALAHEFGVTPSNVGMIVRGVTWAHVANDNATKETG